MSSLETGNEAEEKAAQFLRKLGHKILERNWRFGHWEVDIISTHQEYLVITEVKYRNTKFFGEPHTAVNRKKQRLLIKAAHEYVMRHDMDLEVRFDVVGISQQDIQHFADAFRPYE